MRLHFSAILICLLSISSSALAAQYNFSSVAPNPFSVQAGDADLQYTLMIDGSRLSLTASQLAPILKYMHVARPEDLAGKSFSSAYSQSALALDELRLQALHQGHYVPPTSEQFFDKITQKIAASDPFKCPEARDLADNATLTKILKGSFTKDCGPVDPEFYRSLKAKLEKQSHGDLSLSVSPIKDLDGWTASCGEYFDIVKDGRPVMKLHLEAAANGFQCSTQAGTLAQEPSLKASPHRSSAKGLSGGR